jgi:hypothetical protein
VEVLKQHTRVTTPHHRLALIFQLWCDVTSCCIGDTEKAAVYLIDLKYFDSSSSIEDDPVANERLKILAVVNRS